MTTEHYYHYQYSPPVSPKSIPHGFKRKASLQDDEVESNNLISHSFKKLRLSKLPASVSPEGRALNLPSDNAKRLSLTEIAPVGVTYRNSNASGSIHSHLDLDEQASRSHSLDTASKHDATVDDDDYMPVDDTANRVWVNDLDAEIAEIEAAEAEDVNGLLLSEAGKEHSKIPAYLLRKNPPEIPESAAANMQVILYRDPISISVPEEEDAVRKTITEARQRMRERQAEERERGQEALPSHPPQAVPPLQRYDDSDEDSMELD